jgi:hypothetical protein
VRTEIYGESHDALERRLNEVTPLDLELGLRVFPRGT